MSELLKIIFKIAVPLVSLTLICGITEEVSGLGYETIGNKPVSDNSDNKEWSKGVVDVVNLECRVYSRWVNGNENFYFSGDTNAFNDALRKFANIQDEVKELILRPGPGEFKTFHGDRIVCDWKLQVPGGFYLSDARQEKGTNVYVKYATMTLYVGKGNVELEKVQIPTGVTVIELKDLIERYISGLKNDDWHYRQYACSLLGDMAPYAEEAILPLIEMLEDKSHYVRWGAASALGEFGVKAVPALPALKKGLQDKDEDARKRFQEVIVIIENSKDEGAKEYRAICEQISKFQYSILSKESDKKKK